MGEAFPVFVLCVAVGIVAVALLGRGYRVRRLNELFGALAAQHNGQLARAAMARAPEVRFHYKGSQVRITMATLPGQRSTSTVMELAWADPELNCEVRPRSFFRGVYRFLRGSAVRLGVPRFDQTYLVTGDDHEAIRLLLSAGVQTQIDQLRYLSGRDHVHFSVDSGVLQIRKQIRFSEFAPLAQFVTLGLELFDQATLTNLAGIEITGERMAPAMGEAVCKICGETIGQDIVYCRACKTAHHYECWQYIGACSTYGCGERRHLAGRRAARAFGLN